MELKPHFRVVRFSPAPEYIESVNVALLIIDSNPRLVSDSQFEKLSCIAPSFDPSVLQVWLDCVSDELRTIPPAEIPIALTSKTAQIQMGKEHYLERDVPQELEQRLIRTYLKKAHRGNKQSEEHLRYVDSLISDLIGNTALMLGELLKRAKPDSFLRPSSAALLSVRNVKFSRVIVAPKALILMDGLNLAVASRAQLKQRAFEIDFGFFAFGEVKQKIESLEEKEILRTSFVFNAPSELDKETHALIDLLKRDSDLSVDANNQEEVLRFNALIRNKTLLR